MEEHIVQIQMPTPVVGMQPSNTSMPLPVPANTVPVTGIPLHYNPNQTVYMHTPDMSLQPHSGMVTLSHTTDGPIQTNAITEIQGVVVPGGGTVTVLVQEQQQLQPQGNEVHGQHNYITHAPVHHTQEQSPNLQEQPQHVVPGVSLYNNSETVTDDAETKDSKTEVEKPKPFACRTCNKSFSYPSDLKRHQLKHSGDRPYKCEKCDKSYSRISHLNVHKMSAHVGNKGHVCSVCNKAFVWASKLKKHMLIHDSVDVDSYKCAECGKRFLYAKELDAHMLMHSNVSKYICEVCNKTFNRPYDLKVHAPVHLDTKPYPCTLCEMQFLRSTDLKVHMFKHEGKRPYQCSICEKSYLRPSTLKAHIATHSSERQYFCEVCNKGFIWPSKLMEHMKCHTNFKPFQCEICNKQFTRASYHRKHVQKHTEQKPYKCGICSREFIRESNYKTHIVWHDNADSEMPPAFDESSDSEYEEIEASKERNTESPAQSTMTPGSELQGQTPPGTINKYHVTDKGEVEIGDANVKEESSDDESVVFDTDEVNVANNKSNVNATLYQSM